MTFHTLLQETNFDWEVAKRVFYNLTPLQIKWLNVMNSTKSAKGKDVPVTTKPGFTTQKTFDLRRR